jgi:hypothetical protein
MLYLELMDAIAEIKDGPMCADNNHMDLFYPDPNKGNSKVRSAEFRMRIMEQEAKILCGLCPVKALCAEYAIKDKEEWEKLAWNVEDGGSYNIQGYVDYAKRSMKPVNAFNLPPEVKTQVKQFMKSAKR